MNNSIKSVNDIMSLVDKYGDIVMQPESMTCDTCNKIPTASFMAKLDSRNEWTNVHQIFQMSTGVWLCKDCLNNWDGEFPPSTYKPDAKEKMNYVIEKDLTLDKTFDRMEKECSAEGIQERISPSKFRQILNSILGSDNPFFKSGVHRNTNEMNDHIEDDYENTGSENQGERK